MKTLSLFFFPLSSGELIKFHTNIARTILSSVWPRKSQNCLEIDGHCHGFLGHLVIRDRVSPPRAETKF